MSQQALSGPKRCTYGMQSNRYMFVWLSTLMTITQLPQALEEVMSVVSFDVCSVLTTGVLTEVVAANPHRDAEAGHRPPLLQVGLSIQVGRLYVTHTVGVRRVQEQEVCGDNLIAKHLDKISHSHILPTPLHKLLLFPEIRRVRHLQSLQIIFIKRRTSQGGSYIDLCLVY